MTGAFVAKLGGNALALLPDAIAAADGRPLVLVHLCDECAFGGGAGRCVICSAPGISDAFYCKECTQQEKDVRGARAPRE